MDVEYSRCGRTRFLYRRTMMSTLLNSTVGDCKRRPNILFAVAYALTTVICNLEITRNNDSKILLWIDFFQLFPLHMISKLPVVWTEVHNLVHNLCDKGIIFAIRYWWTAMCIPAFCITPSWSPFSVSVRLKENRLTEIFSVNRLTG